jgi:hypothetical protein
MKVYILIDSEGGILEPAYLTKQEAKEAQKELKREGISTDRVKIPVDITVH